MKKFKQLILSFAMFAILPLASCGSTASCPTLADSNALIDTPITDSVKLTSTYTGKKFTTDLGADGERIGAVTVKSFVDGDTVHFAEEGNDESVKVRFLAINTPESTAKVEPWGKKASLFTKHVLEGAQTIVLQNDVNVFGEKDGSGGRWLAFVWYNTAANQDFRLLNLEIVEQCYSNNQLFKDSTICNYRSYFEQAEKHGIDCGIRVPGKVNDPDYDYSSSVVEVSLRQLRDHYDEYGITEGGSSGKQLLITGLVVGMMGDNMVVRDVQDQDEETLQYCSMYAYAGFGSSLASIASVGYIVKFYCRATMYNSNIQLSDLKTNTFGKQAFVVLAMPGDADYDKYPNSLDPYIVDSSTYTQYSDFAPYAGYHIKTRVTIRTVTNPDDQDEGSVGGVGTEYYYKKDASNNMTVYAWSQASGLALNLRVDGTCYPYPSETLFTVGHTYEVVGYLSVYFDKFQLQLYNNIPENNYIVDVTNA